MIVDGFEMKVLLIDDNKEITEVVSYFLENIGISCTVLQDGKEGVEMIKNHDDYDLILLDIAMPYFSGFDVLDELKKEDIIKSRNIMIFTASTVDEKKIYAYGVKGLIRKPISIDDLQEAVERFKP